MKKQSLPHLVIFLFMIVVSGASREKGVTRDLKPTEYHAIDQAMVSGDELALPRCRNEDCPPDMRHLLRASSLRIQWKLQDSLREARRCYELLDEDHDVTRYACARLIRSDATNLFGDRGNWSTIDLLADALKRGYLDHGWGGSSPASSNEIVVEANRLHGELKKYHFEKESIEYGDSPSSIPLVGDGKAKSFDGSRNVSRAALSVLNYPSAHVDINGLDLVMLIDTGSDVTTLYTTSARKLGIKSIDLDHGDVNGSTGAVAQTKIGMVRSLRFANISVKNKFVNIVEPGRYAVGDGIIGLDLLDKIPAMMFSRTKLLINPPEPPNCDNGFTMSSDFYGRINGIVATGSKFDGLPMVAVLDTGNAAAAFSPTWGLVKRRNLDVSDRSRGLMGTFDGPRWYESGSITGSLRYLGTENSGEMRVGMVYKSPLIDFNIGMPYFYGKDLYISFRDMKMCIFP